MALESGDAIPPASWASSVSRGGRVPSCVTTARVVRGAVDGGAAHLEAAIGSERVKQALGQHRLLSAAGHERARARQQRDELGATRLLGGDTRQGGS